MSRRRPSQRRAIAKTEKKLKAHGYRTILLWVPIKFDEAVKREAHRLGAFQSIVWRAAISAGLRVLTPTHILAQEREYRQIVDLPSAPVYPGAPFDPARRPSKEVIAKGRKLYWEKRHARAS